MQEARRVKGKAMRLADFNPKSNLSLADRAKGAVAYVCGEGLFWVGFFLAVAGATYSIFAGLAVFLGWELLFVLIVRRELKQDIEALDDPNDNLRANRLIVEAASAGQQAPN